MPSRSRSRRLRRAAALATQVALAGAVSIQLGSCSLLLPYGAVRNNHRHPEGGVPPARLADLPGRPKVTVVTTAGDTLSGYFTGLVPLKDEDYRARYEAWRGGHDAFPALGEPVTLEVRKGRAAQGPFLGFGARTALVRRGRFDHRSARLDDLTGILRAGGGTVPADTLLALADANRLPSRLAARIAFARRQAEGDGDGSTAVTERVPLDEIAAARLDGPVANPVAAFFGGLALDALGLLMITAGALNASSGCHADPSGFTFGF